MVESWINIEGFEGYYQVSNSGKVNSIGWDHINEKGRRRVRNPVMLKPENNKGYHRVDLRKNGFKKRILVHRLVAGAFIDNPDNKSFVNHINGIKNDNRVENLEWCTYSENNQHAYDNKLTTPAHGENHVCAKLSLSEVLEIKERLINGEKVTKLARDFKVSHATISNIRTEKAWKRATNKD